MLSLFAGDTARTDGFAAAAHRRSCGALELDRVVNPLHRLELPAVQDVLVDAVRTRRFRRGVLIAMPCESFTVSHVSGTVEDPFRTWSHPSGHSGISAAARAYLSEHDALLAFCVRIIRAALAADVSVILENPGPRGNSGARGYWPARARGPQLWDMQVIRTLRALCGDELRFVVAPHCAFGPGPHGLLFQKFTGFLGSAAAGRRFAALGKLSCTCTVTHDLATGNDAHGRPITALSAAFPGPLYDALVYALSGLVPRVTWAAAPVSHTRDPEASAAWVTAAPPPPLPQPKLATSPAPPTLDRSVASGRIADGPDLSAPIRAAVEHARAAPPRWASFRNLVQADVAELRGAPMPDLQPGRRRSSARPPPTQPGARERLLRFRRALGRNVRITDLWQPGEYERLQRWLAEARRGRPARTETFPQSSLVELARGYRWDCRNPQNCVPFEPSTVATDFPGERQIDREAFAAAAREVGSEDHDLTGQAGGGGVESRSSCELTTVLQGHAPGLWRQEAVAAAAIATELRKEWAVGPFYHPPCVPMRCLARDVVMQPKSRVLPDLNSKGEYVVEDYEKGRITLNPSGGPDPVNGGVAPEEREVALTSARALARGLAIIDVPAREAGVPVEAYGIDLTAAYSFVPMQRLDWWQFCYLWFDADGRAFFAILVRVGFGGAFSPQRFQGISTVLVELARKRQAEFDAAHPLPAEMSAWVEERLALVRTGALPAGRAQSTAAISGSYLDDVAGGCPGCRLPMPEVYRGVRTDTVDLGAHASLALGGKPLDRDSRPAMHLIIAVITARELGFEEAAAKTEGGSALINLGLHIDLDNKLISCPSSKRRVLLHHLDQWHEQVVTLQPFARRMVERVVGRLGNLTQVLPELLLHLHFGFQAANASYKHKGHRRELSEVQLRRGSPLHTGLLALLPHASDVLRRNEGVPLAPRASFATRDESHMVTSDASGDDGCGGYVFLAGRRLSPVVVSEPWPDDIRAALAQYALPAAQRTVGAPALSMPAAELFAQWAVLEAATGVSTPTPVIAVGDCDPAAAALNAASSGVPQMAHLLSAARLNRRQWLGVSVPREWNLDADRLSHPRLLQEVLRDIPSRFSPRVERIPAHCWATLRHAASIPPRS